MFDPRKIAMFICGWGIALLSLGLIGADGGNEVIFMICVLAIIGIVVYKVPFESKTWSIEFNGTELGYFLFSQKKCPVCNEKLEKHKKVKELGKGFDSIGLDRAYNGERYKVGIYYKCERCNKVYSLKELARKNIKRKKK